MASSLILPPFLCWLFWWPIWFTIVGGTYIGWKPHGLPYSSTKLEFRYGHATRYANDPYNQFQWYFGDPPDRITVNDGVRLIIYEEPRAFLKSWSDSIDVDEDTLQHKGYMGIWSRDTHFIVDEYGEVH